MHITDTPRSGGLSLRFSPLDLFRTFRADWRERQAVRHLERLDDHLLRDIGLTRHELHRAVRHGRS